jgi:nucleoid DNA-binding protein
MCKDLKINPNGLQCTNDTLEKITRHMLKQMQLFLNDGIKIKLVAFGDFQSLIEKERKNNNDQFKNLNTKCFWKILILKKKGEIVKNHILILKINNEMFLKIFHNQKCQTKYSKTFYIFIF